jgi:hypothetical protein
MLALRKFDALYKDFSESFRKNCFDKPYYCAILIYIEMLCVLHDWRTFPIAIIVIALYNVYYNQYLLETEESLPTLTEWEVLTFDLAFDSLVARKRAECETTLLYWIKF